jgi:hypothetical protein
MAYYNQGSSQVVVSYFIQQPTNRRLRHFGCRRPHSEAHNPVVASGREAPQVCEVLIEGDYQVSAALCVGEDHGIWFATKPDVPDVDDLPIAPAR